MTQTSRTGQSSARPGIKVINSLLYSALCRATTAGPRYGFLPGVYIANAGMRNNRVYYFKDDKQYVKFEPPGEEYRVCCPFCGDKRHRLYINHEWGVSDENPDVRSSGTVHCFNEECQSTYPDFFRELRDRIESAMLMDTVLPGGSCNIPYSRLNFEGTFAISDTDKVELPGVMIQLDQLPPDHKVLRYIRLRGQDPTVLQNVFDVQFCFQSKHNGHSSRLVFPIHNAGNPLRLVGYTSRYIGDGDGIPGSKRVPKWLTARGFRRNQHLYNLHRAIKAPHAEDFCVVVEGPGDVTNVLSPDGTEQAGPVVGVLGKYISPDQQKLLANYWRGKDILCIPDPDVLSDQKSTSRYFIDIMRLRSSGIFRSVSVAKLPDGVDPGAVPDRKLFWRWAMAMIRKNGNYNYGV